MGKLVQCWIWFSTPPLEKTMRQPTVVMVIMSGLYYGYESPSIMPLPPLGLKTRVLCMFYALKPTVLGVGVSFLTSSHELRVP